MNKSVRVIAETIDVLCAAGRPDLAEVVAGTWKTAELDAVTGLQNRASFEVFLDYERDRALRYGRDLSVIILDVDDFKGVNDALGHLAGDDVLRCVATNILRTCRATDRAARIGGDEFAVILPETSPDQARLLGQRLADHLDGLPVVTRGGTTTTSVTVGVASMVGEESVESLFDRADQALLGLKRERHQRRRHLRPAVGR